MNTAMHKGKQTSAGVHGANLFPQIEHGEEEGKAQTEIALWKRHIQQEAEHNACKKEGPLALGGKEASLKQLAERVTREAQEEYERAILRERAASMLGSYD
jgi:hypothetical protein